METKRRRRLLAIASVGALALLLVMTPTGPTLGAPDKGPQSVEVAAPSSPWRQGGTSLSIGFGAQEVLAGPSATAINLTSLSMAANSGSMGFVSLLTAAVPTSATDCEGADVYEIAYALDTVSTPVVVTFPTPFQVAPRGADEKVCLLATVGGTGGSVGGSMSINASGFYST
jgi:hypothetical protein